MSRTPGPRTLREAIAYFSEPNRCLEFAVGLRWPSGVCCPTCGGKDVILLSTRRLWKCKHDHPRQQFSVKVGTIFEDSPIGLEKWFAAIWMVANRPEDVNAQEIARELDVTQKTAAYMIHRIQLAINAGSLEPGAEGKDSGGGAGVIEIGDFAGREDPGADRR